MSINAQSARRALTLLILLSTATACTPATETEEFQRLSQQLSAQQTQIEALQETVENQQSFLDAQRVAVKDLPDTHQLLAAQQTQIEALQETVNNQQNILDAQRAAARDAPDTRQLLAAQQTQIEALQEALQMERQLPADQPRRPSEADPTAMSVTAIDMADDQPQQPGETDTTAATVTAIDMADDQPQQPSEADTRAMTVSADVADRPAGDDRESPQSALTDESFVGSWRLPGTEARMRIGGFVKMNIINNLDPLQTKDRFIVGAIPPDGAKIPGAEADTTLSVEQSRVNLELREPTARGNLRAFVEGDFAGSEGTFRLRHAFGQYGSMLAGKTWSTLMDLSNRPEEVDFEGINGRINVRQPQLRFFPSIGSFNFTLSLEDPSPDVSGGTGISQMPDVVIGIDKTNWGLLKRINERPGWNARVALIGRIIESRNNGVGSKESTYGWGITASGSTEVPYFSEKDQFLWQLTYGDGVGRYVNDLGTIGGQDAIFSPNGDLKTWPVFAGYLSYQHWWKSNWRSNLTFSWVKVDAYGFQSTEPYLDRFGNPYERTLRASVNLLYSPIPRVELGGELLWGQRTNANNTEGEAKQIQISAKYYY